MRVLSDADGTFLDLNGRFCEWLLEEFGIRFSPSQITCHSYKHKDCPLKSDDSAIRAHPRFAAGGLADAFLEFMQDPHVYDRVEPIPGSIELLSQVDDLTVLTAMMSKAPQHYGNKMDRISQLLPHARTWTCPSAEKQWLRGDIMIEDRFDIARSFRLSGTRAIVIRQPWNEAPADEETHTWERLASEGYLALLNL